jgi:hypothetical protein
MTLIVAQSRKGTSSSRLGAYIGAGSSLPLAEKRIDGSIYVYFTFLLSNGSVYSLLVLLFTLSYSWFAYSFVPTATTSVRQLSVDRST